MKDVLEKFKDSMKIMLKTQDEYRAKSTKVIEKNISLTDSLSGKIDDIQTEVSNLQTEIDSLKTQNKNLETTISSFNTQAKSIAENVINEELKSFKIKLEEALDKMIADSRGFMIKSIKKEIFDEINERLDKDVEFVVKKHIHQDFENRNYQKPQNIERISESNLQQNKTESLDNIAKNIKNNILAHTNSNAQNQDLNGGVIKKIDTEEIRKKILDAIERKNDKINNSLDVEKSKQPTTAIEIILSEVKLGLYKLPCFFDGENIFGIYNADHNKNLLQAGMNDNLMIASPAYLEKIHINPFCADISEKGDMIATKTNECKIYYTKNGNVISTTAHLNICRHCLKAIYHKDDIEKTVQQFIEDFLAGTIPE
ncbi:coiled-coil domain-containing protein [Candidatus Deianiraea vastatrix]|uniref:Uncharacterized protein n=1 Tax=Candidatus Deianiraea vastatrix TaxID=2163644 RepID=A0A5B8XF59_9RICK|nr:hypothetical protein [Candidatus Deianiraea vastatrix]QED23900.1 hypothetical protein Deia_01119 [Candidatus Deianiraea vastatrix]